VNILDVEHRRTGQGAPLQKVEVAFSVETRDRHHADALTRRLRREGYPVYAGTPRPAG